MRLASVVVTRSVMWCGLPKAGSCTRRTYSATAAYSGDSHRSLRIVQDDLTHYGVTAVSRRPGRPSPGPAGRGPGRFGAVSARAIAMWDQSLVCPDPVMICWKASGTLDVAHFPADRGKMARTLARHVPVPLIPRNLPVPPYVVSMPCRFTLSRQVFGSSVWVPAPAPCRVLYVPPGNTRVSTLLPEWSTPAPVNTLPVSMAPRVLDVADVVMSWMLSLTVRAVLTAGEALAGPASHKTVAAAAE